VNETLIVDCVGVGPGLHSTEPKLFSRVVSVSVERALFTDRKLAVHRDSLVAIDANGLAALFDETACEHAVIPTTVTNETSNSRGLMFLRLMERRFGIQIGPDGGTAKEYDLAPTV